jgi:hypothetical protein
MRDPKDPRDPRSEAEKARADLMRNDAMGMAVPESPLELQPSVTPQTFGDRTKKPSSELSPVPEGPHDGSPSQSMAESEQVTPGRDDNHDGK